MKYRLLILLITLLAGQAYGQTQSLEKALEALYSKTQYGFAGSVGYIAFLSGRSQLRFNATYTKERQGALTHYAYGIDTYYNYTLKYINWALVYVKVSGGVTVSQESGNYDNRPTDFKVYKVGAMGGVEIEKYFGTKFSLVLCFNQRYVLDTNDRWGDLRWYGQAGIRYHIAAVNTDL